MIVPTTPLSAMAATPRIDLDNKYTYNHASGKVKTIFFLTIFEIISRLTAFLNGEKQKIINYPFKIYKLLSEFNNNYPNASIK